MKNLTTFDIKNISVGSQKCGGVTSSLCISSTQRSSHVCSAGSSGTVYISGSLQYYYCYQVPAPETSNMHTLAQKYYCDSGDFFIFEISGTTGGQDGMVGNGTSPSSYDYASCIGKI